MYQTDTERELMQDAVEELNSVRGNAQRAAYFDEVERLAAELNDRERVFDLADDLQWLAPDVEGVNVERVVDKAMAAADDGQEVRA